MSTYKTLVSSRCAANLVVLALSIVFALNAYAGNTPVPLWLFGQDSNDGNTPFFTPIFDTAGNMYGTTQDGGADGLGVVFKLTPTASGLWKETVLYDFKGVPDGATTDATLVRDSAGNLYGTTLYGGNKTTNCGRGCGIVFKLTPTATGPWKETVLHRFSGPDGANPVAGLVQDKAGNLYGTTSSGGAGVGTVFKLTLTSTGWKESVIHSFNGDNGSAPFAPLVFDANGNLYGTTMLGGNQNLGTVFKLTPQASGMWMESVLHSFQGGNDGANPLAGVILDKTGNVYGGSQQVGSLLPCGTVFKLTAANKYVETVLHRFQGSAKGDGCVPNALVFDSSGNLFGTSEFGGPDNAGTIFKLTHESTGWIESILYSFTGDNQVEFPAAAPTFGPGGELFGTTLGGVSFPGGGEVFKFVP